MKRNNQAGMTLVEILVAVTLMGLVAGSFAYLYGTSQRFLVQSVNISSSQGEASFALEHIQRNLQLATAVALPANVGDASPALDFTWQANIGAAPVASHYELNGTILTFTPDLAFPGTFIVVARDIDWILFTRSTQSTLLIEIRAERTVAGDTRRTTLRTTVSPRGLF